MFITIRHNCAFRENSKKKKFFVNNFRVQEFQALKFFAQKETTITQLSAASPSQIVIQERVMLKNNIVYFLAIVSTCHVKSRSLNQKLQVWIFQGQEFALWVAKLQGNYTEIIAERVAPIFLSIISLKAVFEGLVMQFTWIFLKIFKYYFLEGNLRKTMKKNFKKYNFLLKFQPGSDLQFFFEVSHFSKVILLICSNIILFMLYILYTYYICYIY